MKRCVDRQAKQALQALFKGELEAESFARLRDHAAQCDECREAYDKLGRVESALEKRALPASREALLEQALFARLAEGPKPVRRPVPERRRWFRLEFFVPAAVGLTLATVAVVLGVSRLRTQEPDWQARGSTGTTVWGVRAFCVGSDGGVRAEAKPGGMLVCGELDAVQFSYTAKAAARLSIEATSAQGEPLRFFPREGSASEVAAGVDIALPYSTPVQRGWLSAPLEVRASFSDARNHVLSQTRVILVPR